MDVEDKINRWKTWNWGMEHPEAEMSCGNCDILCKDMKSVEAHMTDCTKGKILDVGAIRRNYS